MRALQDARRLSVALVCVAPPSARMARAPGLVRLRIPLRSPEARDRQRERPTTASATVELDENDTKLYADESSSSPTRIAPSRRGNVVFIAGQQPDRRRPRRLQHQDPARHLLQRQRHRQHPAAAARRPRPAVRRAAARRPGHRRLLLRRDGREDRARRNTRSPTAASRPASSRRRAGTCTPTGRPEHRSLHAAAQRGLQRQGRAAVLPAGPLLPDQGRGPRDRLPAPDLRRSSLRGQSFTTRSSGRSTAARTRRSCTTGFRRRPGRGRRIPLQRWRRRNDRDLHARSARTVSTGRCPAASYNVRGGGNQLLPGNLRARARVDYFSSIATNQTLNTNLVRRVEQPPQLWRQRRRRSGAVFVERHLRSLGVVLEPRPTRACSATRRASRYTQRTAAVPELAIYFAIGSEFVHFERETRTGEDVVDSGVGRFDLNPQIRYPFKRWQWFTVNSSASWRDTFYTAATSAAIGPG